MQRHYSLNAVPTKILSGSAECVKWTNYKTSVIYADFSFLFYNEVLAKLPLAVMQ